MMGYSDTQNMLLTYSLFHNHSLVTVIAEDSTSHKYDFEIKASIEGFSCGNLRIFYLDFNPGIWILVVVTNTFLKPP